MSLVPPRDKILEIYALPVSGGGFPAQLQQIIYYTNEKQIATNTTEENGNYLEYTPDICLGTSGGNVSAYIGLSGNWTEGGIKRVVKTMNSEMFSQTWWPGPMGFLPTWILGIFEGAIFKPGYGPSRLLKAFSDDRSIQEVEIWSGTFNKTQKRSSFFCNKKLEDSYISSTTYSPFLFKTTPLIYTNGDIDLISKVTVASASVPILFKPVEIGGEEYIDGGVTFSSPLTVMQEEIYNIMKGITTPPTYVSVSSPFPLPDPSTNPDLGGRRDKDLLHIIYMSPYNMDNTTEKVSSALGSDTFLSYMTDASSLKDRYTGINLLERLMDADLEEVDMIDSRYGAKLSDLLAAHRGTHYFCEIYVRKNDWIDMTKFTSQDILNKMDEAIDEIEFLFFYVKNK
jgi:predicted acylesterase/phospholipase RssA